MSSGRTSGSLGLGASVGNRLLRISRDVGSGCGHKFKPQLLVFSLGLHLGNLGQHLANVWVSPRRALAWLGLRCLDQQGAHDTQPPEALDWIQLSMEWGESQIEYELVGAFCKEFCGHILWRHIFTHRRLCVSSRWTKQIKYRQGKYFVVFQSNLLTGFCCTDTESFYLPFG